MAYNKTVWNNGSAPAISAANLNKIEQGIYDNSVNKADAADVYSKSETYTRTEIDNSKQQWFCNPVTYGAEGQTLNSGTDQIMFEGKFRFTPDSQAPENQYDLVNRYMLNAATDNKQVKFCAVDPTTTGYYDLINVDNIKVRLNGFKATYSESQDNEDIMNREMVDDYITAIFGSLLFNYFESINGYDISKHQTLHHEPGGEFYWVDDEV